MRTRGSLRTTDGALAPARRHHVGALCAVRLARQHQARGGPHFATARPGQLVVSRTAARASTGTDLVGAVLLGRDRLAVAVEPRRLGASAAIALILKPIGKFALGSFFLLGRFGARLGLGFGLRGRLWRGLVG